MPIDAAVRDDWSRFSAADVGPGPRFEAWEQAIAQTHFEWSLRRDRSVAAGAYRGELVRHRLGAARLVSCRCDALTGERTPRHIARADEPVFGVVVLCAGIESIAAADAELRLHAGSFALWDSERPLRFVVPGMLEKISLLVPKSRLRAIVAEPERYLGRVIDAGLGPAAIVAEQLRALVRHGAALPSSGPAAERLVDGTLELLGAALLAGSAEPLGPVAAVRAWIEARLDDPELGPRMVARAHGVSVRTLHGWFQREGQSLSRFILQRRLARCRHDLVHDRGASITAIAFRWGFNDAAYFSRAFRRAYGVPPRAVRGGASRP